MNKALDYNKLLEQQAKGKLLKKIPHELYFVSIKYDGNYVTAIKYVGEVKYVSSGGHTYTNNYKTFLDDDRVPQGVYLLERIASDGKLGDRRDCSLRGTRGAQVAYNHNYMVHDYITLDVYHGNGISISPYTKRRTNLKNNLPAEFHKYIPIEKLMSIEDARKELKRVTDMGYEGIMLKSPYWIWRDTTSRTVDLMKWKRRPTVDLLVTDTTVGIGKYAAVIGSLTLQDSEGRVVHCGSGMSDEDRAKPSSFWLGKVVEMFYEQIMHTYIQPTFGSEDVGVAIRDDKTEKDID